MRYAFIALATLTVACSIPAKGKDTVAVWQIIQYDSKEFCAGNKLTWNLKDKYFGISKGGCGQLTGVPPSTMRLHLSTDVIIKLRRQSDAAILHGMEIPNCSNSNFRTIRFGSGLSSYLVNKGKVTVSIPNNRICSSKYAQNLLNLTSSYYGQYPNYAAPSEPVNGRDGYPTDATQGRHP